MRLFDIVISLMLTTIAAAQSLPQFRLQALSPVSRTHNTPILDQAGFEVGWFDAARSALFDTQGRIFMQSAGKLLSRTANANGSVHAALEKVASPKSQASENFFTIRFFNRSGQPTGNYHFSQHRDDLLPQILFEARGEYLLLAFPATARLTFLQKNGQVLREITLFREAPYANERPLFITTSAGTFIVFSQKTPSTDARSAAPALFCFSIAGKEQWQRDLPAGTAGGVAVSDDGSWIVANRYAVIDGRVEATNVILNSRGEPQTTIAGLFRRAIFAKTGNSLLLMDRRQLRAVDFRNGKALWQINLTPRAEMFVDMAATATQDKIFTLVASNVFKENRFVFEKPRILGCDSAGRQQTVLALPNQLFAPVLKMSSESNRLTLGAEGFLQHFNIVQSSR